MNAARAGMIDAVATKAKASDAKARKRKPRKPESFAVRLATLGRDMLAAPSDRREGDRRVIGEVLLVFATAETWGHRLPDEAKAELKKASEWFLPPDDRTSLESPFVKLGRRVDLWLMTWGVEKRTVAQIVAIDAHRAAHVMGLPSSETGRRSPAWPDGSDILRKAFRALHDGEPEAKWLAALRDHRVNGRLSPIAKFARWVEGGKWEPIDVLVKSLVLFGWPTPDAERLRRAHNARRDSETR